MRFIAEAYTSPPSAPVKSTTRGDDGKGKFVGATPTTIHAVELADLQLSVAMDALHQEFLLSTLLKKAEHTKQQVTQLNETVGQLLQSQAA